MFDCHHVLHQQTTVAECRRCPDYEPRLARGRVSTWAVGIVTAPRDQPTLGRCLTSLAAAGWNDPRVFAEPGVEVPDGLAHIKITDALKSWASGRTGSWA